MNTITKIEWLYIQYMYVCMSFTLTLTTFCYMMAIKIQTGNLRPDNTWNGLMFSSRALLRDSSSHTTFDLCTGGLRSVHQFSIVSIYVLTQICRFENKCNNCIFQGVGWFELSLPSPCCQLYLSKRSSASGVRLFSPSYGCFLSSIQLTALHVRRMTIVRRPKI